MRADRDDTARRLRRARAFIDRSYHLPLDLEQIADQAFCSRYHVIRLFRNAFAQTPHQYLTQCRIARAKALLASSDLTITEICFAVGFQSVGSFSALFRRHVGHSPRAYRERERARRQVQRAYVPGCFLTMFGIPRQPTS